MNLSALFPALGGGGGDEDEWDYTESEADGIDVFEVDEEE
jgi:hypothetical protein